MLSRVIITQRAKLINYLTKSNLRKYSSAILKSPFDEIEIPDRTLTEFIWSHTANLDDVTAMTCGESGRTYTYGMVKMFSKQGAMALLERASLQPGDRVALLLPNIPEFMIAVYASIDAGLIVTLANPLHTVEELERQFKQVNVRCIVTIPFLLESAMTIAKTLPNYTYTINIGGNTESDRNILGMQELLTESYDVELPRVRSKDVAVLPYSSGTTGMPKGVMLTHQNLIANILQCSHPALSNPHLPTEDYQETVFTVLPFFHIMGFNAIMNVSAYYRAHIITIPRFTPEGYIKCLETYKPETLFVVPALLSFLATHPEVSGRHLTRLKRVVSGAAPASRKLIEKFKARLEQDDCRVDQGYGMTETSPVTLYTPTTTSIAKAGSCGRLVPSTCARIVSLKNGEDIGQPYVSGELLLKGPQVMKGYLDNPTATSETLDKEGWLHTGDVAYYDDDQYFFIVDRTKELIKVKGNQVSPTELETLIFEISGVEDVAVIGIPDELAGELPKAYIVKAKDSKVTAETIENYVSPKVAPYKRLAGGVSFVDSIPRNPSGKVLRNELKALKK